MSEKENNVVNFIDNLQAGNNADAGEAFKSALRDKVGDALDNARKEIAGSMFSKTPGQDGATSFSDPKPEIAGTGTFDRQGNVIPTGANAADGQAQIDVAADTATTDVAADTQGADNASEPTN